MLSELGLQKVLDPGVVVASRPGCRPRGERRLTGRPEDRDLSEVLREAIACGLEHRAEALEYALQFGRGIDAAAADRFVAMYVNEPTQDYVGRGAQPSRSCCARERRSARSRARHAC